jgi:hypothetical protein
MNQCQLIIEDEVNCKLVGLDLNTRKACSTALKYFIPAARYSAAYKLGRWDGTKSFMTIGGRTYLNLLEVVLPIIQEAGYELDIVDQRKSYSIALTPIDTAYHSNKTWPAGHRFEGQPIELRDYQVDVINSCVNNLQGVAVAPTSAGKTIITSTLSQMIEPYGRSIVIVPNKNLVLQTEEDYVNLGLDVGVIFGDRKEYTCKHTICTWQSLNILDKKGKDALDEGQLEEFMQDQICVIADECFDGDALVLTPTGYKPIKDICSGDQVINYSEETKSFKTDTVIKQHKNLVKSNSEKMYELELDNGQRIKVTGNHKFLTTNGWIRAVELSTDHEIIGY